ncbi:EAL domain-containing protein [Thiohalocapsa marina]|uniref:EAL domain-containing protein n=2 Tax=Thiohalocapsa marina TaxID=424902 RepID=A0A5M8FTG1_9GAMM|nr:EAL domain-containing protein [Thiohalocapsa marina]
MAKITRVPKAHCAQCHQAEPLGFEFTMALQPIVRLSDRSIYSHEALVRGLAGESARWVFEHVNADNLFRFDQACRVKAIQLASQLRMESHLNINFTPTAVYHPERCIQSTLEFARATGFPLERIIFEFTETEKANSPAHLNDIVECYRSLGFKTAIDDFGACYSGLNLLAQLKPDQVKLDAVLVRNIDRDRRRQAIVRGLVDICRELEVELLCEGIETADELAACADTGIDLCQGYWFAKPLLEAMPSLNPGCFEPLGKR